ncbi:tail sheath stabilizer and completion protein [uncultured Caudovirales phage]|uniref:Tail sheath stabilizer and completion protein n=1 Tax=uncultured Caudovirales phage TaxID=2100421 RepID=A0A6J7WUZ9_9CAUD|nr:tail sheath stabilizer and completion protein [uncultured Caudovirales phage]
MLNQKFYWGTIRKSIVAFGNLFNNIYIDRFAADGSVAKTLKVPLAYAPKQKFLARIAAQPQSYEQSFETYLPRLGFEMVGIQYDPARRVSLVQQNRALNSSVNTLNAQYAPTPYNISMALYAYVKNQDDGLQITEQILPFFNPDYNLTLNAIPAMGIKNDLPIILDNVTYDDEYEGDFSQRRAIIWTMNFTMKLNFYGPVNKQGIIRTTNVNTFSDPALANQQTSYTAAVDPTNAQPGDLTGFTETFEDF